MNETRSSSNYSTLSVLDEMRGVRHGLESTHRHLRRAVVALTVALVGQVIMFVALVLR